MSNPPKLRLADFLTSKPPAPKESPGASLVNQLTEPPDHQTTSTPANQIPSEPLSQTTVSPDDQHTTQPVNHVTKRPRNQTTSEPAGQSTKRPARHSTSKPSNRSTKPPVNQTAEEEAVENFLAPGNWSTNSANQLTRDENQPASQPVNQSTSLTAFLENSYRSRIERRQKGIRLPVQKLEAYEAWCFAHKIDFQDAVEMGMDWVTSGQANHMMINESDDSDDIESLSIARFYENWTGNKWNAKDKAALAELAGVSSGIIECGIMLSVIRRAAAPDGQKINSFRYCFGAIRETQEAGIGDPVSYMKSLRRYAEKVKIKPGQTS